MINLNNIRKHKAIFILLFMLFLSSIVSAVSSKWTVHLAYTTTSMVEVSNTKVYAVANGSLYIYDTEDSSIKELNKTNGLNDTDISLLKFDNNTHTLLIVYIDGNIDLLNEEEGSIYNLPFLKTNTSIKYKDINSIYMKDHLAYLSGNFGVMVVNLEKKEIKDTYRLDVKTFASVIKDSSIIIATEEGLKKATLTDNLLDRANWTDFSVTNTVLNESAVRGLYLLDNQLCALVPSDALYVFNGSQWQAFLHNSSLIAAVNNPDALVALTSDKTYFISSITSVKTLNMKLNDVASTKTNTYWVAAGEDGIKEIVAQTDDTFVLKEDIGTLNGPFENSAYSIVCANQKVYVVPGGKTSSGTRFGLGGTLMIYNGDKWSLVSRQSVADKFGVWPRDYTKIALSPSDPTKVYVSSFGDGVVEFTADKPTALYNNTNSALTTIITGDNRYNYIDGLVYDAAGNLWMTNSEVKNALVVYDASGQWHSLYVDALTKQYTLNDILITKSGIKWVNIPRINPGIVMFDEGGTLDDQSDDKSTYYTSFIDQDGRLVAPSRYTCMAEDNDGFVWVGTNLGLIYFDSPSQALTNTNFHCSRVKLANEDGSLYYFLNSLPITCVTVDSGNRKWIGTENDGVYVLNSENNMILYNFNVTNSPLLSNHIYSIAMDNIGGKVYIGTNKGILSYEGNAIQGSTDYSEAHAYPNPVRPTFDDKVTITGLKDNTTVKITTLTGQILYQVRSVGGEIEWNCCKSNGERVATGVYLVMGSDESGESVVCKIAIVN